MLRNCLGINPRAHPKIAFLATLAWAFRISDSSDESLLEGPQAKLYLRIPSLPITAL